VYAGIAIILTALLGGVIVHLGFTSMEDLFEFLKLTGDVVNIISEKR
jgi:hypothetical protein